MSRLRSRGRCDRLLPASTCSGRARFSSSRMRLAAKNPRMLTHSAGHRPAQRPGPRPRARPVGSVDRVIEYRNNCA
jgi:hypothetical protein